MDFAFTVATGKRRFFWAARLAMASLRRFGGFQGETVIYTDRPGSGPEGVRVELIEDPEILGRANWMKMRVREFADLPSYDHVAFIDADILVQSSFEPFLRKADETGKLVVCDDLQQPIGAGLSFRFLTAAEKAEHGETVPGINGGFFCGRGDQIGEWLAAWEQMQRDHIDVPGPGFCQAGVNTCSLRGQIPTERIDGEMWFPKRDPDKQRCGPEPTLVHFHGIGRHLNRYFRMRKYYKRLG